MNATRGLRAFGHPLHASLSHFPLALLGIAVVWDAAALLTGDPSFSRTSFWSVAAGLIAAVPVVGSGFWDFAALAREGERGRVAALHMTCVLGSAALFGAGLLGRGGIEPAPDRVWLVLAADLAGAALLGLGGWFGGELVFHHGVGVGGPGTREGRAEDQG